MKKQFLIVGFVAMIFLSSFAQNAKRNNIWYFGYNAGINFNTTPPTALSNGAIHTWEGCATICDTTGQILLYTDGRKIWNKNHQIIPGAVNLGGDNSATQSGIIMPFPNAEDSLFYVFSVDAEGGSGGLRYAVVDITQNNGLGGLVSSNNVLLTQCSEKLTVVRHCNRTDFWLIAHSYGGNSFFTWQVTNSGISSSYTTTSIGTTHSTSALGSIGYMKSSPNGSKLALGVYQDDFFEVFDFNNQTGQIANPIQFTDSRFDKSYGVEFSPNGKRLYMAGTQTTSPHLLFQINLDLPTTSAIKNSLVEVGRTNHWNKYFGAIQIAPNGKIYVAKDHSNKLAVINNPNAIGIACNYVDDAFSLGTKTCGIGLPNLIPSFFEEQTSLTINENIDYCNGTGVLTANVNTNASSVNYQWYLNNALLAGQNSAQIQVNNSGLYRLDVIINIASCSSTTSTYSESVNVEFPASLNVAVDKTNAICGQANGKISINATGGKRPYQYSFDGGATFQTDSSKQNLAVGTYNITIKDDNDCSLSQSIAIADSSTAIQLNINSVSATCGQANGKISINATGGKKPYQYSFDGGTTFQTDSSKQNLAAGSYNIKVKDDNGCSLSQSIAIADSSTAIQLNINSVSATCGQANGKISINAIGGKKPYQYSFDGGTTFQTDSSKQNLAAGSYNIKVKDDNGCSFFQEVEVSGLGQIIVEKISTTPALCGKNNGTVSVVVTGGDVPIQIALNGGDFQEQLSFYNLSAQQYTMQIIDEKKCTIDTAFTIEQGNCAIDIPNAFSPNNDGVNDNFKPLVHADFKGKLKTFRIYDRWGKLVFDGSNNSGKIVAWNGTHKNEKVELGTYVYFIEYILENGTLSAFEGTVTVIR